MRQERKVVTALFADLVGFTSRAEQMDPEDVAALLSGYHAHVKAELERHGGTVEKFIGDAVMAVFGAPTAHEDDPERAVRAALAIREWGSEEGIELRIGINTGEALVTLDGEPLAAGDVVNTAARLQAAAPVNGVLVGEATYRATERVIDYRQPPPVGAKGKAQPVAVWEATGPRARFGVDAVQTGVPLVGRRRELDLLVATLERTREERSAQLVTLVGVPGIGKSRLVYELYGLVDADPELLVWRQGRSLPYGDGVTYWALSEMVKAQAGILETDDEDEVRRKLHEAVARLVAEEDEARWIDARLQPLVGLAGGVDASSDRRDESFAAWRRFFEALADADPAVLIFEDLHWADENLLDFVDHLAEWAADVPLLIVGTARPELLERRPAWGGGKPNAHTLSLSPLSDEETARLLAALLERAVLPADQQAALLARAGGNPLYAEQYARMLLERRGDELPLPETVQGIIAARLDALPVEEKALLQDAAVLGKVFWLGAVCAVAEVDRREAEQRFHALERKEFVRRERRPSVAGESEYVFRHLLVRDVAYGQIPRADRAESHRLAAEWIQSLGRSEDHAEMLAHHYQSALELARAAGRETAGLEPAARNALREAGDRARALNAYGSAVRFYEAALELWPEGEPGRGELLLHCGEALYFQEHPGTSSAQALEQASEVLLAEGKHGEAAEAEIVLAITAFDMGLGEEASAHTLKAIQLAESLGPTRSKAYVFGWSANRFLTAGISAARATQLSEEAVQIARSLNLPELRASALNSLGICRVMSGDLERGVESLEEALEIARVVSPAQAVRAYGNLASVLNEVGDLRRARTLHEQGLAIGREFAFGISRWLSAEVVLDSYLAGEWTDVEWELDAELARIEQSPFHMEAGLRGARARISLARDDLQAAVRHAEQALASGRRALEQQSLCPALGDYAVCLLAVGGIGEADGAASELVTILAKGSFDLPHKWFLDLALVMCELGRGDELVRLASSSPVETLWMKPAVAYAEGRVSHAAELLAEIGARPAEAYVRLRAGDEANVRRALDFWRSVGATRYVREGEALLAASA